MIIITGAAGFIGSVLVEQLNRMGYQDLILVDDLKTGNKWKNIQKRDFSNILSKSDLEAWLKFRKRSIQAIFHLGACSSTTEEDADYLMKNNFHYSQSLFEYATEEKIPFFYASSAATYGMGEHGFLDDHSMVPKLLPINKYGFSKQIFDKWVLSQKRTPPSWFGFKFFNVYGPNEYHKHSQASVIFHAYPQIKDTQKLKLFKSYKEGVEHGNQKRDFVYVKDVVKILNHFLAHSKQIPSGIYNIGSGVSRSFADLGKSVFNSLEIEKISFDWIDMPDSIKDQYQYFTEANLEKLKNIAGYTGPFYTLEEGCKDYISQYLSTKDPYL